MGNTLTRLVVKAKGARPSGHPPYARQRPVQCPREGDISHAPPASGRVRGDTVLDVATATPSSTPSLVKDARSTRSTIFLKLLMAASGLFFILFVLVHMYGNLKAFGGHDSFNAYAEHLRTLGEPILPRSGFLWILRALLLLSLVVHVYCAAVLWRRARAARTHKYVVRKNKHSTFASHLMRWGGVTLLLFIVWHLLNFSIGKVNVTGGATNDPYNLLVDSFDTWWLTLIYLAAMAMLGAHLHHGFWSSMQTLGWTSTSRSRAAYKRTAFVLAVVIAGGFCVVPLFVLFGVISK
jgi:succinate dehydrogenase / fumarate reductase cytochrome b subunit